MANAQWQATLDELKRQVQTIDRSLAGAALAEAVPSSVRAVFSQALEKKEGWDNSRIIFTLGQLDLDVMIACSRAGFIPWWPVLNARVAFGDLAGVNKVHAAYTEDPGKGEIPGLNSSLTWGCHPYVITDGVSTKLELPVVQQLLAWGADPNYENGDYFEKTLRGAPAGIIGAFLDHGAFPVTAFRVLDEQTAKDPKQAAKIQEALAGRSLYAKLDDQILAELQHVPGPEGGGVFRTLFNFRARRVNEIYEYGRDRKAVMNGIGFDEYDQEALAAARARLEKLGGHPAPAVTVDKPRLPRAERT
jgi:hypothetical protein